MFFPHPRVKVSIAGSLCDRKVECSASDHQGSNFESCVWRTVSFPSSHHPQEVLLAQFILYVHKGGLKPDSFHFLSLQQSSTPSRAAGICFGQYKVSIALKKSCYCYNIDVGHMLALSQWVVFAGASPLYISMLTFTPRSYTSLL